MRNNYRQIDHLILPEPRNFLINTLLLTFNLKSVQTVIAINPLPRLILWGLTFLLLIGILSALFLPRISVAAEWSFESSVGLAAIRDDNPTLTTGVHESDTGVSIYPRLNWAKTTETSAVNLEFLLSATEYSGDQAPDTNTQRLTLNSYLQTTERTKWGLDGDLRRDFLFEDVQTTSGTGDLQDTDVGLVTQKVRRDRLTAKPSWSYALSERSTLGVRYGITDVSFSDAVGVNLVDYKNHQLAATYSYRITQRDDLNFTLVHSAYRSDVSTTKSDSNQLLAGITHAYTETTRGRFIIGVGETSEKTTTVTDDTSNYVLEAGLQQRSELTRVDGVISRDVQPSGIGRTVLSNQFRMRMTRKISPILNVVLRANMFRNKVLEGTDPDVDRRYYQLRTGLNWQWRPEWAVGMDYQYRRQKYDTNPEIAESNALIVGVTYTWPRQVTSR